MGRFDEDKGSAFGGNYLGLKNGNQAIVRVLEIGDSFVKEWPSGGKDRCRNFILHVEKTREDSDAAWEEVNEQRRWTPAVKQIVEFICLTDHLDHYGEEVIHGRRLLLKRKDREGSKGFSFGWIQCHDQGDAEGFDSHVPTLVRNDKDPDHAYAPPPNGRAPTTAPIAPSPASNPVMYDGLDYASAKKLMALEYAKGDDNDKIAIVAAWKPVRENHIQRWIHEANDAEELGMISDKIAVELKSDTVTLAKFQIAITNKLAAIGGDLLF
jgi:hypothetical protein